MSAEHVTTEQEPVRTVRTVVSTDTLAAIDRVESIFGVDYSVVAEEGQPSTTRAGEIFTLSNNSRQIDLQYPLDKDLGEFWQVVGVVEELAKTAKV